MRAPSAIRSAITLAASAPAERRTGAPFSPTRSVRSAGSHSATVRAPCGEPSSVTSMTVCADQLGGGGRRDGGRGAGEDHRRLESRVARAQPQQPAQHHRHVGAENASVVMAFVDHDEAQVAQEHRPAGVVAQQRQVDHVGVGEDPARPFAGEAAHLGRAVAVVGRRRDVAAARSPRRSAPARCAAGRGRVPWSATGTAPGPARSVASVDQDRQLIGQRLARRGAGAEHHVAAAVGEVGGRRLMRPRRGDAAIVERRTTSGSAQCGHACGRACRGGRSATWRSGCSSGSVPSTAQASSSRPNPIPTTSALLQDPVERCSLNCSRLRRDCRWSLERD